MIHNIYSTELKHNEQTVHYKLPVVLDKALLVVIEVLATTTLQSIHAVSRHDAEEVPYPIKDHTYGPTITLIAPP